MKIAVLGTGNMGKALISGLRKIYADRVDITAYDPVEEALRGLDVRVSQPQYWFTDEGQPDVIIIAVKPQDVGTALSLFSSVNNSAKEKTLWLSIAAGINMDSIQRQLPQGTRICRVMPNTPALIGYGMSAFSLNSNCTAEDKKIAESILSAVGRCVMVPEKQINAITGLSGSGPAYVYLFIESLIEGGITAGLPYATARECAIQTVLGSAMMVSETGENTNSLKLKVMSPGGTTAYGLKALEEGAFKDSVINAVLDATKRADEMGGK